MSLADNKPLWVIYGLRLVDDFEYRYVGYTTIGLKARWIKHRKDIRYRDCHVHRWIRQHGVENIVIDLIEECPEGDIKALGEAEEFWIAQIKSFGHNLTNLNDGGRDGNSGWKHTEETRRKISEFHRGNTYLLGKKLSASTKQKISEAGRGRKHSPETIAKMKAIDSSRGAEQQKTRSTLANHMRWHVSREIKNPNCVLCCGSGVVE